MKLFVCSDIHSAYTPWMKALDEAGFDPNDDNHKIILCGDLFDRMDGSVEVYKFAMDMIKKDKLTYIVGNHEHLLMQCLERGYPYSNDFSNGTYKTICDLGEAGKGIPFDECCVIAGEKLRPLFENMVNYWESANYIFVHSFIPVNSEDGLPIYYVHPDRKFSKIEDWRNADYAQWQNATWGNPFQLVKHGLLPDKILTFGHWHCSTGWAEKEGISEFGEDAKFDAFYGDGYIALDSCVAHSGKINVVVIEDDLLEENNNNGSK